VREKVRHLAGVGVRQDDIAKIVGCAPKTLRKLAAAGAREWAATSIPPIRRVVSHRLQSADAGRWRWRVEAATIDPQEPPVDTLADDRVDQGADIRIRL
jgi:hypothetical protein